ncbi:MAG: DUF308 domain-containing protein [Anaerolineales bacterium]|nr:DUF308 domain-containing protein [Anaerolineales bacterium]
MTLTARARQEAAPWWMVLIQGIAALIIGILLLTNPAGTTVVLVQFMGIYWLISGIFSLVSMFIDSTAWGWKLFSGILGIGAGFIVLQHPFWSPLVVGSVLIIILGVEGLVIGVVNLIQAFRGGGWGVGVLGALSIIFGIILLANVWVATFSLPLVLGIFGVVMGIVAIVMAFRLR